MDLLERQVRLARRRLGAQRFLDLLGLCWAAAIGLACVPIAVDKFWPLGLALWVWIVGALTLGTLAAAVLAFRRWGGDGAMEAAVEIDRRFALKERVSSALALDAVERETAAGLALTADALRHVGPIDLAGQFPVRPSRRLLQPLPAVAAAALIAWLVPQTTNSSLDAAQEDPIVKKQIQQSTDAVRRRLAEHRQKAKEEGLRETERLFSKLESETKRLRAGPLKEKTLAKLNDLSRELAERRRRLGGDRTSKSPWNAMKNIGRGPADQFAQALSRGDFQRAAEELKKLQDQLSKGKLDARRQAELARQFDQMREKINKTNEVQKAAERNLQQQAEQMRKAGQPADAEKLEEQLAKLCESCSQTKESQGIAKQLENCSNCLGRNDPDGAAQSLRQAQEDLEKVCRRTDELAMLDDAMQQLSEAKDCVNGMCSGQNNARNSAECGWEGIPDEPGRGIGRSPGPKSRAKEKPKSKFYDSQVRQQIGQGGAVVVERVGGPNLRGEVRRQIQEQVESSRRGTTAPLSNRLIPRKQSEHTREYFDGLREGEN